MIESLISWSLQVQRKKERKKEKKKERKRKRKKEKERKNGKWPKKERKCIESDQGSVKN